MQVYNESIGTTPLILHLHNTCECHIQAQAVLFPGKEHWVPLNVVPGGAQMVLGVTEESLGLSEIENRTV
jgi:hypothetical protein